MSLCPTGGMAKLQNVKGCHWETVCVRMLCQNLDGRPHCCNPRNNQPRYTRTNLYPPWTQVFPDTYLACACLTPVSRQGTEAHHDDTSVQETSLKAPEMLTVAPPGSRNDSLGRPPSVPDFRIGHHDKSIDGRTGRWLPIHLHQNLWSITVSSLHPGQYQLECWPSASASTHHDPLHKNHQNTPKVFWAQDAHF